MCGSMESKNLSQYQPRIRSRVNFSAKPPGTNLVELVKRRRCAPRCRLKFLPAFGKVFTTTSTAIVVLSH